METQTKISQTDTPAAISFEARLEMAAIGMNVLLDCPELREANEAVLTASEMPELLEPPAPVFQPHPVLKAAGDLIQVRGWAQGGFTDESLRLCAWGAIREVVYGPGWDGAWLLGDPERGAVTELLNRIAADTGKCHSIPGWNDSRKDASEVLRLLY